MTSGLVFLVLNIDESLNWAYVKGVSDLSSGGALQVSGLLLMFFSWLYFIPYLGHVISKPSKESAKSDQIVPMVFEQKDSSVVEIPNDKVK